MFVSFGWCVGALRKPAYCCNTRVLSHDSICLTLYTVTPPPPYNINGKSPSISTIYRNRRLMLPFGICYSNLTLSVLRPRVTMGEEDTGIFRDTSYLNHLWVITGRLDSIAIKKVYLRNVNFITSLQELPI